MPKRFGREVSLEPKDPCRQLTLGKTDVRRERVGEPRAALRKRASGAVSASLGRDARGFGGLVAEVGLERIPCLHGSRPLHSSTESERLMADPHLDRMDQTDPVQGHLGDSDAKRVD